MTVLAVAVVGCTDADESPGASGATEAAYATKVDAARQCIRDRGWEIVDEVDGFSSPVGIPASQFDTYTVDVEECMALHAPPVPASAVSEERWEAYYEEVVTSAECLRNEGIDVPETVTYQELKDSYLSTADSTDAWVPWSFVPVFSMDVDVTDALEKKCPQVLL